MNLDLADDDAGSAWLAALDAGAPWRAALEAHLLAIDLVEAERLMQVLKEGRGTWLPLVLASAHGSTPRPEAWLFGNALSGSALVLARLGYAVRLFDPSATRRALALHRDRWLADGRARADAWTSTLDLARFDAPKVAVVEGPVPASLGGTDGLLARLRTHGTEHLWHAGDNRLGYKRSTGVRADLRVQSPWRFVRDALVGSGRTLPGYRRAVGRAAASRALVLYPHRWDFSLVVDLDRADGPQLFLGPGERTNRIKMLGHRLGLFRWLTPSFAVGSGPDGSGSGATPLVERVLRRVEEESGEAVGRVEHLVATRGNNALALTSGDGERAGRFAIHLPLGPDQERQMRRHARFSARIAAGELPGPRVPEPVWCGRVDGVFVEVERRVGAINAAQLVDEAARERFTLPGCVELLADARLAGAPRPLTEDERRELVFERAVSVAERAGRAGTADAVLEIGRRLAAALADEAFPRVVGHGDLRAKHVATDATGRPLALLDLGCARGSDLPLVDLLNLVLHDRKDDARSSLGAAWREAVERRLPEPLERVLNGYAERLGLSRAYDDAIRAAYPLFVASSAEQFWDYSRPRWVHRQLGV